MLVPPDGVEPPEPEGNRFTIGLSPLLNTSAQGDELAPRIGYSGCTTILGSQRAGSILIGDDVGVLVGKAGWVYSGSLRALASDILHIA